MSYASPWNCPHCDAPVRFSVVDKDEAGPVEECVAGCGVLPVVAEWRDIRAVVVERKTRRLLGPSCLSRRHRHCNATGCQCLCHEEVSLHGAQA